MTRSDAEPDPEPSGASSAVEQGGIMVTLSDERAETGQANELDRWADIVLTTALEEGVEAGTIDVLLVDEDDMAELNREHMGAEGPTDVLSFPLDDEDDLMPQLPGIERHLGDIVLCNAVAERQAPDHCGRIEDEITLLLVHGVLHLLGHDHAEPDETAVMRARERCNLDRYGVVHPEPV